MVLLGVNEVDISLSADEFDLADIPSRRSLPRNSRQRFGMHLISFL